MSNHKPAKHPREFPPTEASARDPQIKFMSNVMRDVGATEEVTANGRVRRPTRGPLAGIAFVGMGTPQRKRRPLRVEAARVRAVTDDGVEVLFGPGADGWVEVIPQADLGDVVQINDVVVLNFCSEALESKPECEHFTQRDYDLEFGWMDDIMKVRPPAPFDIAEDSPSLGQDLL